MKRKRYKSLRTTSYISDKKIKQSKEGPQEVLQVIRAKQFQVPIKPPGDIDELLQKYHMPANLSEIEPYQKVRDYLGFYTSEASRALFTLSEYRARRRTLNREIGRRKSVLMGSAGNSAKWRAEAQMQLDKKLSSLQDELDVVENVIDIMDTLFQNYSSYVRALSREMTARTGDRDNWYGRGGDNG